MGSEMTPTDEQQAAIAATRNSKDSILLEAYAGCAKTTTLTLMSKEVKVPALALAFNVSIKKELQSRFAQNFSVQTMNGLGMSSLMRGMPSVNFTLDTTGKKLGKIVSQVIKDFKTNLDGDQWDFLRSLVRTVMLRGLVPKEILGAEPLLEDTEANWQAIMLDEGIAEAEMPMYEELAREILLRNIQDGLKGFISYDDQIYLSTLIAGRFPKFPVILGDEIQDFSPLDHAMLSKSVRPDGRLIMVGDKRQSIYAFRGSDSNAIGKIKALRQQWIELPLTMTFRCPKVVVERQQRHVPGFRAAPSNKTGTFAKLPLGAAYGLSADPDELPKWGWADVERLAPAGAAVAVLCRNNAPLLKLGFKLLRKRISFSMLGRDIGAGLVGLSKTLFKDNETPKLVMADIVFQWSEREKSLALANGQEEKIDLIEDKAECFRSVFSYEAVENAGDLRRELNYLFAKEDGKITLSSIHKAKGKEWDVILLLDPWRLPSKWAKQEAQKGDPIPLEQEMNLKYVAETRTKDVLIHASMDDFE